LFEEVRYFFILLTNGTPTLGLPDWYFPLVLVVQIFFLLSSTVFLGLLLWSIVLFVRA